MRQRGDAQKCVQKLIQLNQLNQLGRALNQLGRALNQLGQALNQLGRARDQKKTWIKRFRDQRNKYERGVRIHEIIMQLHKS